MLSAKQKQIFTLKFGLYQSGFEEGSLAQEKITR